MVCLLTLSVAFLSLLIGMLMNSRRKIYGKRLTRCQIFSKRLTGLRKGKNFGVSSQDLSVSILTGIPTGKSGKEVKKQKMMWSASHLSDQIPVLVCQKHIYSGQNHVLIDDNPEPAHKGATLFLPRRTGSTYCYQLCWFLFLKMR